MNIHHHSADVRLSNVVKLPSSVPGAELIEQRIALQKELRSQFGTEVARVAGGYIRDVMHREGRTHLDSHEHKAVSDLGVIAQQIASQHRAILPGHSAISILSDAFAALLKLHAGQTPQPLHFLATTCPDYPFDPATESYLTEGGVGDGVGLCAMLLIRGASPLLNTFAQRKVPLVFDLCFADIEGQDPHMLSKARLSPQAFLERLTRSASAASEYCREKFRSDGIDAEVRSSFMTSLIATLPHILGPTDVPASRRDGIMTTRLVFYRRFFAEQIQAHRDPLTFYQARATKDILDHVNVGRAIALGRAQGRPQTLVTLSAPALANLFQFGSREHVPVVRLAQSY